MIKYKNKNFKISVWDSVIILFLAISFLVGGIFLGSYYDTASKYNIEKTSVDFIIPSPSKEQIISISALEHVSKITPYGYASKTISGAKKTMKTNIYIVDKIEDVSSTVFSDELLISKSKENVQNPIFISSKVADVLGANVGDSLTSEVFEKNICFTVSGIYEDDQRSVGGMVVAVMTDELLTDKPADYSYSGAYISSSNYEQTKSYLDSYKPLGDLRSREDFKSDESYQIYLEARENTDYTKSIFYCEDFKSEIHGRNDAKLARELSLAIVIDAVGILAVLAWALIRPVKYCKNEVLKDIKNNYTIEQEQMMFNDYFLKVMMFGSIGAVALAILNSVMQNIKIFSLFNIVSVVILICLIAVAWKAQSVVLKNEFVLKKKELDRDGQISQ